MAQTLPPASRAAIDYFPYTLYFGIYKFTPERVFRAGARPPEGGPIPFQDLRMENQQTSLPSGYEGLTFEKVWATIQEIGERFQETDRILKEQARETGKRFKKTDRMVGELCNRFGELAEHLVAPGIVRRFNDLGYHFDDIIAKQVQIADASGRILTEIDLLLENGEYSIAVEVKSRPRAGDVEHHIRRLELLREHKDRRGDRRKIRGAIAGAVFPHDAKEAALGAGLYVIEQSGETMKLSVPAGFVPGEW